MCGPLLIIIACGHHNQFISIPILWIKQADDVLSETKFLDKVRHIRYCRANIPNLSLKLHITSNVIKALIILALSIIVERIKRRNRGRKGEKRLRRIIRNYI